jgi:hypothetical protein
MRFIIIFTAIFISSIAKADGDGLDEVNALRASRGLKPFLRDEGLTEAARLCSQFRASYSLFGHTNNDFAFCKVHCDATGCAAYPVRYGWMSCCTYENYTSAGAYWTDGRDGKRYMHLFVSYNGPSASKKLEPPAPIGDPPSGDHEWNQFPDGQWGWRLNFSH